MKAFVFAALLAVAMAVPIEDTEEVKAARAEFMAAFAAAEAGEHAMLAPEPVATAYIDDSEDVAEAKKYFQSTFDAVEKRNQIINPFLIAPHSGYYNFNHAINPYALNPYTYGAYPYTYGAIPYTYGAYPYVAIQAPAKTA